MKESLCNENLRKIRRTKDYTQEYVAFELNISQKAYSEIEQGKTKMKTDILLKLSSILDVSPSEICLISCNCNNNEKYKLNKILKYLESVNFKLPKDISEE